MPKLVRDLLILIVFCGAFYLLIVLVRGESHKPAPASNFSQDRIEGDRMLQERNWEQAIVHFSRIVKKDKYNSLAMANICRSKTALLYQHYFDYREKSQSEDFSEDKLNALRNQIREEAADCITPLEKLAKFEHHRGAAYREIAELHSYLGNDAEAVDYLRNYVEYGDFSEVPIYGDSNFNSLHHLDEFHEVIKLERRKRGHFRRQRDFSHLFNW